MMNSADFAKIRKLMATQPKERELLTKPIREVFVNIKAMSFASGWGWSFFDGSTTWDAKVEDDKFLNDVAACQRSFKAGDLLKVRVKQTQKLIDKKLQSSYEILEVLSHQSVS